MPSSAPPLSTMDDVKVYPDKSVEPQISKLSLCDVYAPKIWVTQCHFWPCEERQPFERTYEILKQGLARVLSEIPELAGRITRGSDDPRDIYIEVNPNASIDFSHEDLSIVEDIPSYLALRSGGFPVQDIKLRILPDITLLPVTVGSPIFTAKLNKLKGGLCMTFGLNHLFADMSSVSEVERLWSLHTADVSSGRQSTYRPAINDVSFRERLSVAPPGAAPFNDPHWMVSPTQQSQLNLPAAADSISGQVDATKWCMWRFSPENLTTLKKDASSSDATKWISTIDALIGLLWSRISFVKQKSQEGFETSEMLFPINARKRLHPPLHSNFLGNVVDLISAECPLADLEAGNAGLVAGAQCVRRAVTEWEQSKFEAWLGTAASLPNDQAICPHPLMLLASQNMTFNDYSKSQSNSLDWGIELGYIESTRYTTPAASMAGCATTVVVYPKLRDGGLEVVMTCSDAAQQALLDDPVLQRYAQFRCCFG
ncbi:hypothetical protein K431DRAFT_287960 [Polychaeton citri CBS 116435]|uniref:Trichothecene 3-O-acetyltransferase n=1 Tax=Polychaeton citri CBS 116435 TaxID=1314669 RepID=A0A9P4Q041_9PEZI|nr:hypothetical protein K431DRAFT_287960 [Polychaeton citri CBS 116435]